MRLSKTKGSSAWKGQTIETLILMPAEGYDEDAGDAE